MLDTQSSHVFMQTSRDINSDLDNFMRGGALCMQPIPLIVLHNHVLIIVCPAV